MICPTCGSHIDEGTLVCPACHAELDRTTVMPRISGNWCSSCGSLLPEGATTCPNCHMPVQKQEDAHIDPALFSTFPVKAAEPEPAVDYIEPNTRPESMAASFATLRERGLANIPDPDDGAEGDAPIDPDSTAVAKALNFAKAAVRKQAEEMVGATSAAEAAKVVAAKATQQALHDAKKDGVLNAADQADRPSDDAPDETRLMDVCDIEAKVEDVPSQKSSTNLIPRFDSAIPEEPSEGDALRGHDHLPRMHVLITALFLGAAFITAGILYMTQPWNPEAFSTKATQDADTSMAGFPGTIDSLAGQDNKSGSVTDADQTSYNQLHEIWQKLGELEKKVDDNEAEFKSNWNGNSETRSSGKNTADSLRYEISNEISAISDVDTSSGTYTENSKTITTLGNYLRNRIDALYSAWDKASSSDDPESDSSSIFSTVGGRQMSTTQSWRSQFEDLYTSAEPKAPGSSS